MTDEPVALLSVCPSDINGKLIIAYVIANLDRDGEAEISDRVFQQIFVRVSRQHLSRRLNRLEEEGWLVSSQTWRLGQGTRYRLGTRIDNPRVLREWCHFSRNIFGSSGLITPWLGHPLMAKGSLQPLGLMILEFVRQHPDHWTQAGLARSLSCLSRPETVQKRVRQLTKMGLLIRTDGLLHGSPNLDQSLNQLAAEWPIARREKILTQIEFDRKTFYRKIGISCRRLLLSRAYMGRQCIKCDRTAAQIEHVPPKSWGGQDDWFLTYPICVRCNPETKTFIQLHPLLTVTSRLSPIPRDVLPLEYLSTELFILTVRFYFASETNNPTLAHECVDRQLRLFRAFSDFPLRVATQDVSDLFANHPFANAYQLPPAQHERFLRGRPELNASLTSLPIQQELFTRNASVLPRESERGGSSAG